MEICCKFKVPGKYLYIYRFFFSFKIQGHFFDEYALEGVSEEANEIFLELAPENLTRALKTAQNAKWIKIKLTKKHSPCLTFEVDLVKDSIIYFLFLDFDLLVTCLKDTCISKKFI